MYPVLATLGTVTVYSFGLFLALGLLFGTYQVWKYGRLFSLPEEKLLDGTLIVVLSGLVGARLLYVASNPTAFAEDPWSAAAFWRGGLSFWGALIGGMVAIRIIASRFHWPAGNLFDLAAPAVALGSFFGYIGALLNGSAYGAQTDFVWGIKIPGLEGMRHPTQVIEALLQLALFVFLISIRRKVPFAGFLGFIYIIVYSMGRFVVEFLRGDQTDVLGPLSQAQLVSLLLGVAATLLLYLRIARLQGSWRVDIRRILVER